MIEINVRSGIERSLAISEPNQIILGIFAFRYDHALVPDLLTNIAPMVDGWISWDDRQRQELWYHEGNIRQLLIAAARDAGADWVLCVDPDERYEARLAAVIRELTREKKPVIYGFPFRELYRPDSYRVDGIWGDKIRWNLFPLLSGQEFMNHNVHSGWFPINADYEFIRTDFNLYHLKMIAAANRIARRDLYKAIDVNSVQEIGYDYLTDEDGARFEVIPCGREYSPGYRASYDIKQTG